MIEEDLYSAKDTFRGFRAQTLYVLHRIIKDKENLRYRPEGREDLDILLGDEIKELVQVKYHNKNLTLSHLSPKDKPKSSFLRRSAETLKKGLNPKITLASFGPIGHELKNAFRGNNRDRYKIKSKLIEKGYKDNEIDLIFKHIKLKRVDEDNLKDEIFNYLKETHTGMDPKITFDLLMNWIYTISEKAEAVNKVNLVDRLNNIAYFLTEISSFLKEYGISVKQLEPPEETLDLEILDKEFYAGISARYEHILANLDVNRPNRLNEMKKKMEENHVLILHGASGQGKSTLAYRFLHEYYPSVLTYQIKSKDRDALRIISTLHAISKSINDQITIFIDAEPRDITWPEIVKELARYPKFNVLVTIREEDWKRSTLSGVDLLYSEMELYLDKEEAEEIYENLTLKKPDKTFLDFEDSWLKFGGEGPLLEFTYLITQGQTLKDRLEQQVDRIREESIALGEMGRLDLLRIVSIIGMYGGKTNLKSLISTVKLKDPGYVLKIFQEEYLLREGEGGMYIEALHPIRSEILVEFLSDPILCPIGENIETCISVIYEEDLEIFLLNCFLKYGPHKNILVPLESYVPSTWVGYGSIIKSLLWLGIKDYINVNEAVIDEAYEKFGSGWNLALGSDLSDAMGDEFHDFIDLDTIPDETKEESESLRNKLEDKSLIYKFLKRWLIKSTVPSRDPKNGNQWSNFGFSLFWLGKLEIKKDICFNYKFVDYFNSIYLGYIADFMLGLYTFDPKSEIIEKYRPIITKRFKKEFLVPLIEDDDEKITLHCIIDLIEANKFSKDKKDYVHESIINRLTLIRKLYPEREKFASRGYGNKFYLLESDFDETKKEIRANRLPFDWLVNINSIFIQLINYNFRMDTWKDYVNDIIKTRENSLIVVKLLIKNLNKYFKTRKFINIFELNNLGIKWDNLTENLEIELFPKVAVDPLGFTSESIKQDSNESHEDIETSAFNLKKFNEYNEAYGGFISHLSNFCKQSINVITLRCLSKGKITKDMTIMRKKLENENMETNLIRLSVINLYDAYKDLIIFQQEFMKHFKNHALLSQLEEDELLYYGVLAKVWNTFVFKTFKLDKNLIKKARETFSDERNNICSEMLNGLNRNNFNVKLISLSSSNHKENYFVFNVSNPAEVNRVPLTAINTIKNELKSVSFTDFKRLLLDIEFEKFKLIFLLNNKLLLPISYNFPLFRALNNKKDKIDLIDLSPKRLEGKEKELGIEKWEDVIPEIAELNKIYKIEELQLLIYHLKQLLDLELDDLGFEITQEYAHKVSEIISEDFQSLLDFLALIINLINNDLKLLKEETDKNRISEVVAEKKEILEKIGEIREKCIPGETDDSGRIEIATSLKEIDGWYNGIQESKESIYNLYFYFVNQLISEYRLK